MTNAYLLYVLTFNHGSLADLECKRLLARILRAPELLGHVQILSVPRAMNGHLHASHHLWPIAFLLDCLCEWHAECRSCKRVGAGAPECAKSSRSSKQKGGSRDTSP